MSKVIGKRKKIPVDLEALNKNQTAKTGNSRLAAVATPTDLPAYVRIHRLEAQTEHVGYTTSLDFFTLGVKVFARYDNKGELKVFVEDSEGRELVAHYEQGE